VLQLLRIVRENAVVIVVGETGSGKTTQLTQVCGICYFMLKMSRLTAMASDLALAVDCVHVISASIVLYCIRLYVALEESDLSSLMNQVVDL